MEIDAVLEVEAGDPQIAIDFLVANVNLSKSRLKDLMNKGGVWRVPVDGERHRIRRAMTDIFVGEQIEIFYDEHLLSLKPLKAELISDMGQYSVWNKPQDMTLEGNDWGDFNSFRRAVDMCFYSDRPLLWIASLDYEAAGLTVIPHTRKSALAFSEMFHSDDFHQVSVHYRVDVIGDWPDDLPPELELDDGLSKTRVEKVRYDRKPNRSVLDIWPKTGRFEQVRRFLGAHGFPIFGDIKYGLESDQNEGIRFRCVELSFKCPVSGDNQHFSLIK